MNRIMKRIMAIVLAMVLFLGATPATGLAEISDWSSIQASAKTINEYAQGDLVTFGWYPQSKVTDTSIKAALNNLAPEWDDWQSYGYYYGRQSDFGGDMTASDYMRYCDIVYNHAMYRGVKFTLYRPIRTNGNPTSSYSYQDENGYKANNVYWFKYEPLQWRVLDPDLGLILCEQIVDSQAFHNYFYMPSIGEPNLPAYGDSSKTFRANDFAHSSHRAWLNNDFYNAAFVGEENDAIQITTLENASLKDKLFLLSSVQVNNSDYFSSASDRQAEGTDYAKCQGLYVPSSSAYSEWWLRTASSYYYYTDVCSIGSDGRLSQYSDAIYIEGIRPALNIDLSSEILQPDDYGHRYECALSSNPTCTDGALKTYTCVLCGDSYTVDIEPLGHDYNAVTTAPTCTAGGYTIYNCTRCGESFTEIHDRIPHQYDAIVTAPTATKGGYTTYTCSMCGRKVTTHETPPTGSEVYTLTYNANGGTVQQEATYSKTYSKGNTITKQTPIRTGYTFVAWYPTLPTTMPNRDLTVYAIWKPEHTHATTILNQQAPTCDAAGHTGAAYCTTCNEVLDYGSVLPATGHAWDKGTVTTEATCTVDGVRTYTCKDCGTTREETIPAWGHCYDNGLVIVNPTCVDAGEKEFCCAACGLTYTKPVPANGHSYNSGAVTTDPTCTEEGVKTFTCTVCSATRTEPVAALGHNYTFAIETLPTCTVDGVMRHTCTRCGDTYTKPINAAHKYNAVRTEPTCTEDGAITYTCTVCGDSYADPIEKLGHTYKTVVTAPTCTAKGYTTYTCSRCNDTYKADETDMIPHSYKDVVTAPTCTQKGYTTHTCTVCGNSYTSDETDTIPHSYKDVVTAPTCTEKGYTTHTCTVCGYNYTSDETEIIPHIYDDWEWETEPTINTDGLLVKKCSTCGNRIERQVEKTYLKFDVLEDEETGQEYAVVTGLQDVYPDKIVVPAELAGAPVTRIAEYAFFMESEEEDNPVGYSFIEAEILAPIEELEEAAFKYCTKLRSVMLPDSLKVIGDDAFYCCSELQRIDLPEQVESIGDMAFAYCVNLQQVTLPQGLKSIGYAAFGQCKSMQQIKLPECVEYLDEVVFAQSGLMELTIPASLSGIEGTAFVGCPKMTAFHVDTGNSSFMAVDGVLFDKSGKTLIAFPMGRGDTEYTVPDGVETIGMAAFDYVLGDKDVYDVDFVPASLQMVCLPSSLKTIGDVAFYGVTQMQSIDIPDGVTEIGEVAFAQCIGLKRVTIPAGIQTIGASAFDECDSLQAVCYAGTSTSWNRISIGIYNDALNNARRYYHRHDQASATLTGKIDPTCTSEGYTGSYTFACGYVLGTGEVIPALGHAYRTEVTAPTCEANGYTTYICTRCGSSYMDEIVDAIGHDYIVTKHKDASCTESGYDIYGCTHDPSHTYTQTIPAKGHDYKIEIIPPTCETKGYTSHTCTRCGERYVDNYVNALGHDFGEWVQTKAPTVDAEGEETRYCSRCEAKETRSLAKLTVANIKNFTAQKIVDYKATVTFTAEIKNAVTGADVHWFIDGKDKGAGNTYTVTKAKESFTVQAKYIKDGKVLAESGVETVNVKTGFFAKLAAFFRSIFGALPKVVQGYFGTDIAEGF